MARIGRTSLRPTIGYPAALVHAQSIGFIRRSSAKSASGDLAEKDFQRPQTRCTSQKHPSIPASWRAARRWISWPDHNVNQPRQPYLHRERNRQRHRRHTGYRHLHRRVLQFLQGSLDPENHSCDGGKFNGSRLDNPRIALAIRKAQK